MKKVFISSPYKGDTKKNLERAIKYCREAYIYNKIPIAPHVYFTRVFPEEDWRARHVGLSWGKDRLGDAAVRREGRMNYAEKMEMECRLLGNLADWMVKHGRVLTDRQQSNAFCGIRIREVIWRGNRYDIVEVDGMTCQIERQ